SYEDILSFSHYLIFLNVIFLIINIAIFIKVAKLQNLFQYRRICFKKSFDEIEFIIRYYIKETVFWEKEN
uniref:hypothetical protein n=1 Tax=Phocaeicola dorei TaxID=357276 RepID=UPI00402A492B